MILKHYFIPIGLMIMFLSGCVHKVVTNHNPELKQVKVKNIYLQRYRGDTQFNVYQQIKDELDLLG
jgi:hypothetical protein